MNRKLPHVSLINILQKLKNCVLSFWVTTFISTSHFAKKFCGLNLDLFLPVPRLAENLIKVSFRSLIKRLVLCKLIPGKG